MPVPNKFWIEFPAVLFNGFETSVNPGNKVVLTEPTAFTEYTCAIDVPMPAALRAAVRSSVLVLILILYVPCVAPISQNVKSVSIPFFEAICPVRYCIHPCVPTSTGRWVHFPLTVASAQPGAILNRK